jgi:outer membrane protein TolC
MLLVALSEALAGATAAADQTHGSAPEMVIWSVCAGFESSRPMDLAESVASSLQSQPQLNIARADLAVSRSDVVASWAPFYPTLQAGLTEEKYRPNNGNSPVVVVGNTVLGGSQTNSAYGTLSLNWNLMNSGRDVAAYHSAAASWRSANSALDNQLEDTLLSVLQAHADLYEAEAAAQGEASALTALRSIESRALERYRSGHGTTIAVGQARNAALDAEEALNKACRDVVEKGAALAQSSGMHLESGQSLVVAAALPLPILDELEGAGVDVEQSPAVRAAKERLAAAEAKLREATRSFGPSLTLSVRRDYLGQDPDSIGYATHHLAPNDYRIGVTLQQTLFPFVAETALMDKQRAELRRARAGFDQARLDEQSKFTSALAARREAEASYLAAKVSLNESEQVLTLTQSQYRAGRTDLDSVQQAEMDRDKAAVRLQTLASRRALAQWLVARASRPVDFPALVLRQLHIAFEMPAPPEAISPMVIE